MKMPTVGWCETHGGAAWRRVTDCEFSERIAVPADIWEHVLVILNEFNEHPIPELLEDGCIDPRGLDGHCRCKHTMEAAMEAQGNA